MNRASLLRPTLLLPRLLSPSVFPRLLHSSAAEAPLVLQIWGANTGVGKTVLSAALLRTAERASLYLKPVQSGHPADDDAAIVQAHAPNARPVTLHTLSAPVSPDLAAELSGAPPVTDAALTAQTAAAVAQFLSVCEVEESPRSVLALVETAGGVLSPAPSGTLQADVYRPLRLPGLLLGDPTLGGISTTLAAYEALKIRGYDVPVVVLFAQEGSELENEASIERQVKKDGTSVFQAPHLPPADVPLAEYFRAPEVDRFFLDLHQHLRYEDDRRFQSLKHMHADSKSIFWYPFTQHRQLENVTCIDSASGDNFTCYDPKSGLHTMADAIGSWWTNGVGHGNVEVSKAVGRACGRYGHVMFPEATHEPAFNLAKLLLDGPGKGWATRVFFSDDGSTAVEVALKMAFRKRTVDLPGRSDLPVHVVAVNGCYHGDTLGVMDCAPSSDFNRSQTPWYQARGLFFEPPTAGIVDGVWRVRMPSWLGMEYDIMLRDCKELFDTARSVPRYEQAISDRLDEALASGVDLGALLLEPVLLGAGGMQLVDPAFQRALVTQCRARGVPVIFDEVFTGLWRLGAESGAALLGVSPDIATYGKLLTGGTVPLSATLATEEVFTAFDGESKAQALLHGHSYTAHPIGCAAGVESFRQYNGIEPGREYWDGRLARELSCVDGVAEVTVVGTVLAVRLEAAQEGYAATGAQAVVRRLANCDVFARPLGNIVYIMCTPLSSTDVCANVMRRLHDALVHPTATEYGKGASQDTLPDSQG